MLPKKKRLNRAVFSRVSLGKAVFSPLFTLRVVKSSSVKEAGFSVVVSKKVFKNATDRNALRRRIYTMLQEINPEGVRGIVYAKKDVAHATREMMRTDIQTLFQKVLR